MSSQATLDHEVGEQGFELVIELITGLIKEEKSRLILSIFPLRKIGRESCTRHIIRTSRLVKVVFH